MPVARLCARPCAQPRARATAQRVAVRERDHGQDRGEVFIKASKSLDDDMANVFKNRVEVVTMTPTEYAGRLDVAKKSFHEEFATDVADGKHLVDPAIAVE